MAVLSFNELKQGTTLPCFFREKRCKISLITRRGTQHENQAQPGGSKLILTGVHTNGKNKDWRRSSPPPQ